MLSQTKAIKKFVGSFIGIAGVSAFIGFPGLAQANLSSQSVIAQSTPTTNPTPNSTPTPNVTPGSTNVNPAVNLDREFMIKAAQSDMTEIQTSQLALKRSQNKSVRDYARRMIREHKNSSKQLMQIAKQKNVTLPKDIGPENQALITKLSQVSGNNFDQAYMEGQVQAHAKTQAEYQKYLEQGQDQELRAFATKIAPIVADHLQMAQRMVAKR
ncbi:MAG: DUF4142 domain-containing protein [Heteroscytonema crispum UTEX LB 1556]